MEVCVQALRDILLASYGAEWHVLATEQTLYHINHIQIGPMSALRVQIGDGCSDQSYLFSLS